MDEKECNLTSKDGYTFTHQTSYEWKDISNNRWRIYDFGDYKVRIDNPKFIAVSKSSGHRIMSIDNNKEALSHYIPSGWNHLYWGVDEGKPNFVI